MPRGLRWLYLSVAVLALDQWTKHIAAAKLQLYESVEVLPSLNFTLLHNTGAAFSIFADASGWQRWFFTSLAILVGLGIVIWLARIPATARLVPCALALVLGGTLGNLVDRLTLGHVIDFIDVYYRNWHWPAFNVADSAISAGVILLLVDTFRKGTAED